MAEQAALETQRYSERGTEAAESATTEDLLPDGTPAAGKEGRSHGLHTDGAQWRLAVGYALLSSGIALGLDLAGMVFGPVLFLAWLWIVSAPILTVGFYHARARAGRLTAGFAARLGLLTGLLVSAGCALVFSLGLLLARYALHTNGVDTQIADAVAQVRANAQAQYGSAAQPMLRLLGIPEFRVGFLLWMGAVTAGLYLLVSAATAGLAGLLLSRRKAV